MIRLSSPSGFVVRLKQGDPTSTTESHERDALLLHSGAKGKNITLMSGDGEISFDEDRIKRIVKNHNAKIEKLTKEYGGEEKMPLGAYPPFLDQHADDSSDRIRGRVAGLLRFEKRDVPGVGKDCACVIGPITFLGGSIDKVMDGRIYHLSVGIDEKTDTLDEVSSVIVPAAPGAMILKKGKLAAKKKAAQKKLKGAQQMSKKKLAAAKKARLTRLSAIRTEIKGMSTKMVATSDGMRLAARQSKVLTRLSGAMKTGKLTPAERKGVDVKRLAALSDDALDAVLSVYDSREPQVMTGQRGTTTAAGFGEVSKSLEKRQITRLKAETRKDLKRLGAKLKADDEADAEEKHLANAPRGDANAPQDKESASPDGPKMNMKHLSEMKKHLESGDIDKAKSCLSAMENESGSELSGMEDMQAPEEQQKQMMDAQSQMDEMKTNLARLAGMVEELYSGEEKEDVALEGEDDDSTEMAGESEDESEEGDDEDEK